MLLLSVGSGGVKVAWDSGLPFKPELPRLFKLESSTNSSSTNWVLLSQQPVLTNNRYTVTINPTNKLQFFRLRGF